jgi:small subunit ribosomal protein S14
MAKKSMISKAHKKRRALMHRQRLGLEPKPGQRVRTYNRCNLCGRPRGYMRRFGICRVCFRAYARRGEIMGVRKSSW